MWIFGASFKRLSCVKCANFISISSCGLGLNNIGKSCGRDYYCDNMVENLTGISTSRYILVGWSKNLQVLGDACVHVRTYKYLVGQLIRAEIELR